MLQTTKELQASIIFEKHQNNLDKAQELLNQTKQLYRSFLEYTYKAKTYEVASLKREPWTLTYTQEEVHNLVSELNEDWQKSFKEYRQLLFDNFTNKP